MQAELAQMVVDGLREARIDGVGGVDDRHTGFLCRHYGLMLIPRLETLGFSTKDSRNGRISADG